MRSLANIDKDLDRNNFKIGQQITSLRTIVGMEKHSKQDMTRNRNAVLRLKVKLEAEKIGLAKEYLEVLNKDQTEENKK